MGRFVKVLALVLLTALCTFLATKRYCEEYPSRMSWHGRVTTFDTVTYVDTVKYVKPMVCQEKPNGTTSLNVSVAYLKEVLDSLPRIRADTAYCHGTCADSVQLQLANMQTVYSDSTYMAWISGLNASLDSIYVYPKREVITIKHPPKRWHIGLAGGCGATRHGLSPYIGVGITYSIISF